MRRMISQNLIDKIEKAVTEEEVKPLAKEAIESASAGTIQDALGLDEQGNLVKGAVSGGTKLYKHTFTGIRKDGTTPINVIVISTDSENKTPTGSLGLSAILTLMKESIATFAIDGTARWQYHSGAGDPSKFNAYFSTVKYDTDSAKLVISIFANLSGYSDIVDTVTEL